MNPITNINGLNDVYESYMNDIKIFSKTTTNTMRPFFLFLISALISITSPLAAKGTGTTDPVETLQKEVVELFNRNPVKFDGSDQHEITVGFMINAKNEIIVVDIDGESEQACNFVRQVLNYQKIKYAHSRQLTRYSIKINLVSEKPKRY